MLQEVSPNVGSNVSGAALGVAVGAAAFLSLRGARAAAAAATPRGAGVKMEAPAPPLESVPAAPEPMVAAYKRVYFLSITQNEELMNSSTKLVWNFFRTFQPNVFRKCSVNFDEIRSVIY